MVMERKITFISNINLTFIFNYSLEMGFVFSNWIRYVKHDCLVIFFFRLFASGNEICIHYICIMRYVLSDPTLTHPCVKWSPKHMYAKIQISYIWNVCVMNPGNLI
jgi:hypothetical protein